MSLRETALVDVLDADPDLGEGVTGRCPPLRLVHLPRGPWRFEERDFESGLLVLDGFLVRRVEIARARSIELLGSTDILRPGDPDPDSHSMIPSGASWSALTPVDLATLDQRFGDWAAEHPAVLERLSERLVRRSRTLALRLALVQLPVSARLHFLLWHLADRFGTVGRRGVALPVPLSHAHLAELVSSRRPSVSTAMKQLERGGAIEPLPGPGWLLTGRPTTFPLQKGPSRV